MSEAFETKRGLKQGGVSSCGLFLLVIDILIKEFQHQNLGENIFF